MPYKDPMSAFLRKVDASGGEDACHLWIGQISSRGYGRFCGIGAHRWILGHLRGEPLRTDEYALHHCDTPACVNPRHLYVGSHEQNMRDMVERRRGRNWLAQQNALKTHCPRGHEYTPENTGRNARGSRHCKTCFRVRYYEKKARASA